MSIKFLGFRGCFGWFLHAGEFFAFTSMSCCYRFRICLSVGKNQLLKAPVPHDPSKVNWQTTRANKPKLPGPREPWFGHSYRTVKGLQLKTWTFYNSILQLNSPRQYTWTLAAVSFPSIFCFVLTDSLCTENWMLEHCWVWTRHPNVHMEGDLFLTLTSLALSSMCAGLG